MNKTRRKPCQCKICDCKELAWGMEHKYCLACAMGAHSTRIPKPVPYKVIKKKLKKIKERMK